MSLEEDIKKQLIDAMKAKEALRVETLRSVKAVIERTKIDKGINDELSDADIQALIQKQVKQRQESYDSFSKAGRTEAAEKEKAEMGILEAYLPKQLDDDELKKLVLEAIAESGASSKADMGKVMKAAMPKIAGRADGKRVNAIVAQNLS